MNHIITKEILSSISLGFAIILTVALIIALAVPSEWLGFGF